MQRNTALRPVHLIPELGGAGSHASLFRGPSSTDLLGILEKLPLQLPANQGYLFTVSGEALSVAPLEKQLTTFSIDASRHVAGSQTANMATTITLRDFPGITKLVIYQQPMAVPNGAKNLDSLAGPVDLLEEYAQLSNSAAHRALTPSEQGRRASLIREIGNEYAKIHRRPARGSSTVSQDTSYSGESRSSSRFSGG
jgi:hypothetical protein